MFKIFPKIVALTGAGISPSKVEPVCFHFSLEKPCGHFCSPESLPVSLIWERLFLLHFVRPVELDTEFSNDSRFRSALRGLTSQRWGGARAGAAEGAAADSGSSLEASEVSARLFLHGLVASVQAGSLRIVLLAGEPLGRAGCSFLPHL